MQFKDYKFGYADADKEYVRLLNYFDIVFYDPLNNLDKLLNDFPFIVVGRKGIGKSAYCAKIRAIDNENICTTYLPLNEFEYSTFEKTSSDKNITGTQKFKHSWNFVLLCLICKTLYCDLKIVENEGLNEIVEILNKLGFSISFNYKQFVNSLSKIKAGVNLKHFDLSFEKQFGEKPNTFVDRITSLNDYIISKFDEVYLADKKVYLLLDGVDDVLRFKKNRIEILNSLVRSIDYLNNLFVQKDFGIKIIIFIRDEIFTLLNDTDMNKIKQDSSIFINWNEDSINFQEIIKLRLIYSGIDEKAVKKHLKKMFPNEIQNKKFWDYLLEYTLYKPRDVIQFFKCCQELYGNNSTLSYSEVKKVIKYYSSKYFIDEMKNSLSGFVKDELITIIPAVFTKISTKSFTVNDFTEKMNNQIADGDFSISESRTILFTLYELGYIGQVFTSGKSNKTSVQFKYRNPTSTVDYNNRFIIHRGITIGLGVRM